MAQAIKFFDFVPTCPSDSYYYCETFQGTSGDYQWPGRYSYEEPGMTDLRATGKLSCNDCTHYWDWTSSGFTYEFFGQQYTGVYLSSNGFLSFTSNDPVLRGDGFDWPALPDGDEGVQTGIVLQGGDLDPKVWTGGTCQPRYSVGILGSAPDRWAVIDLHCIEGHYESNPVGDTDIFDLRGQIVLFESTHQGTFVGSDAEIYPLANAFDLRWEYATTRKPFKQANVEHGTEYHVAGWEGEPLVGQTAWRKRSQFSGSFEEVYIQRIQNVAHRYLPTNDFNPCASSPSDGSMLCTDWEPASWSSAWVPRGGTYVALAENTAFPVRLTDHHANWRASVDGVPYTVAWFSSNGIVGFNNSIFTPPASITSSDPPPLPSDLDPDPVIAGFWSHLFPTCFETCNGSGETEYVWYQVENLGTEPVPNYRLTVGFENIQHFFEGNPVTFQYQFTQADQSWRILWDRLSFNNDGNNTVIGWENHDGSMSGPGIYDVNHTEGGFMAHEAVVMSPSSPCGEVRQFHVTRNTILQCDVLAHSLIVDELDAKEEPVTLQIAAPWVLQVQIDKDDPVSSHIYGNIVVNEGATFYFDDYERWGDDYCSELATWHDDYSNILHPTGSVDVKGLFLINTCPSLSKAIHQFDVRGDLTASGNGIIRTTGANWEGSSFVWDGYLPVSNGGLAATTGSGKLELGYLYLYDGGVADIDSNSGQESTAWKRLILAGPNSQMTVRGQGRFRVTQAGFNTGYVNCSGQLLVQDDAILSTAGYLSTGGFRYNLDLDTTCHLIVSDPDWSIQPQDQWAFVNANYGIYARSGSRIELAGGRIDMGGSDSGRTYLDPGATGSVVIGAGGFGGRFYTASATDLVLSSGTIEFASGYAQVNGGHTLSSAATLHLTAVGNPGPPMTGYYDAVQFEVYGDIIQDGGSPNLRVHNATNSSTTRMYTGSSFTGSTGLFQLDNLLIYQDASVAMSGSGEIDMYGDVDISCVAQGGTDGGGPARLSLSGIGVSNFKLAGEGDIEVGYESWAPAGGNCDAEFHMGGGTLTADSIFVRWNGSRFIQDGGDITLVGDYGGTTYGFRLTDSGDARISAGSVTVNPYGAMVAANSELEMPAGGSGTFQVINSLNDLNIYGTATIDSGSLTLGDDLIVYSGGLFTMADGSNATVQVNDDTDVYGTMTLANLTDPGTDVLFKDTLTVRPGGSLIIQGGATVEVESVLYNRSAVTVQANALLDANGGVENGAVGAPATFALAGSATVTSAQTFNNTTEGTVVIQENGRFLNTAAFTNWNTGADFLHAGLATSTFGQFNNYANVFFSSSGGIEAASYTQTVSDLASTSFALGSEAQVATGYTLIDMGQVDLTAGARWTATTNGTFGALEVTNSGVFNVSGGTLVSNGSVAVLCPLTCGQLEVTSGAVQLTSAAEVIRAEGDQMFRPMGGVFTGGGLSLQPLATVVFDNDVRGDFSGQLSVSPTALLRFESNELRSDPADLMFATGLISGTVTQGLDGDPAYGDVGFYGDLNISGSWTIRQHSSATDDRVLQARNNLLLSSGTLTIEPHSEVAVTANLTLQGTSPALGVQGLASADRLVQNAGLVQVNDPVAQLTLYDSSAHASGGHEINDGLLEISAGTYDNFGHFNNLGYPTGLGLVANVQISQLSGAPTVVHLTRNTGSWARFSGATAWLAHADGVLQVADDLLIENGGKVNVSGGAQCTVADRIQVDGATSLLEPVSPALFTASSLRLVNGGQARFNASGGTPTYTLTGAVGDGLTTPQCTSYSRLCSIQVEGATSTLQVEPGAALHASASIYNTGVINIAQNGVLRDLAATGLNYVYNGTGGQIDLFGLLDAEDWFVSLGTVRVQGNAAAPHGLLDVGVDAVFSAGTGEVEASASLRVADDLLVEGSAILTSAGTVTVGVGSTSNNLRINATGSLVQQGGSIAVSGLLSMAGTSSASRSTFTQNAGTLSIDRFEITNANWTVGAGVVDSCTRAVATLGGSISQVNSYANLTIDGSVSLVNGVLTDGVSAAGSNLRVGLNGVLTVNPTGSLLIHRQLAVPRGTVTNQGRIAVTRSDPPSEYNLIGCSQTSTGVSCSFGGGTVTNSGDLWLGNELYLQGTSSQLAQYSQSATGDLRLGCLDFDSCVAGDDPAQNGAIHIGTYASFTQNGGSVTTSTGYRNVASCGDTAAVTVQGNLQVHQGSFDVNGNLCLAANGRATIDDNGSFASRGLVTIGGEAGATADRDGDVILKSGSILTLDGWGHLVAQDVNGELGSSLIVTGTSGVAEVVIDLQAADRYFPLVQLDQEGADSQNAFSVGQLLLTGGTLWADHTVSLLGRTGEEICNDGADNDGDGLADCADPACFHFAACRDLRDVEDCNDGADNDGDSLVDCGDPECWSHPACEDVVDGHYGEVCGNGVDDDGDTLVDCGSPWDPECAAWCGAPPYTAEVCNDGIDNDGDTLVDCADPECLLTTHCGGGFDSAVISGTGSVSVLRGSQLDVSERVRLWVAGSTTLDLTGGSYSATEPNRLAGRRVVFTDTSSLVTDKDIDIQGQVELWNTAQLLQTGDRVLAVRKNAELRLLQQAEATIDANLHLAEFEAGALSGGRLRLEHLSRFQLQRADDSRYYLGGSLQVSDRAFVQTPMFVLRSNPSLAALGAAPAEIVLSDEGQLRSWTDPALGLTSNDCFTPDLSPYPAGASHPVPTFDRQQSCSWIHGHATLRVQGDGGDRGGPDGTGLPDGRPDGGLLTNQRIIVNAAQNETVRTTTGWHPAVNEPLGLIVMGNGLVVKHDGPIENYEDAIDVRRDSLLAVFDHAELRTSRLLAHTRQDYSGTPGRAGWIWVGWGATLATESFDLDGYSEVAFFGSFDPGEGVVVRLFDQQGDPARDTAVTTPTFWAPQYSRIWTPPDWISSLLLGPISYPGTPSGLAMGHAGGSFLLPGGAGVVLPPSGCDICHAFAPDAVSGEARLVPGMTGSAGGEGVAGPGGLASGAIWITGGINTLVHLAGDVIADGQDAPTGGGGGASGGGVYIRAHDLEIGSYAGFSARGGAGSMDGASYLGGGGAGGFILMEYTDQLTPVDAFTLLRNSHVGGGQGAHSGGHGIFAVAHWDSTNGRIDNLYSTNLVFRSDPTLDPPPEGVRVWGNWTQLGPTGGGRGLVSDTADLNLTVDGALLMEQTDYLQSAGTVNLAVGTLNLNDSRWLGLVDPTAPEEQWELAGTLHIVSSGSNSVSDDSVVAVASLDIDGASGDWTFAGSAGHPVRVIGDSITLGGDEHNIDTLQLGPFATMEGNVAVEADIRVTIAADLSTRIDASGWGLSPGEPASAPGVSGSSGGGGGYGGGGGTAPGGASGGAWYDSAFTPVQLASYGGNGVLNAHGGPAGGSVSLVAPTCSIGAPIRANGQPGLVVGSDSGGGGAGGRIRVECANITLVADGTADLVANGGSSTYGGGGGGGRILIRTDAYHDFRCQVQGGAGGDASGSLDDGEVGTCGLLIERPDPDPADLYVQDGFRLQPADDRSLNLLQVLPDTLLSGVFDGTISIVTWQIDPTAIWRFDEAATVTSDTIVWSDDGLVGNSAIWPDLNVNLASAATFNADMNLGHLSLQPASGVGPLVQFGTGASITTARATSMNLTGLGTAVVAANARLDLEGTADLGTTGPGAGDDASLPGGGGAGGGFGGSGGDGQFLSTLPVGGTYYASSLAPTQVAGDGGQGVWSGTPVTYASGGRGGGQIRLVANRIDLDGVIDLDGRNGGVSDGGHVGGGGGAGGAALLDAQLFDITPATFRLDARGGAGGVGAAYSGGSGGGGRVLFRLRDNSASAAINAPSLADILASGASVAAGSGGAGGGQPGTMGVVLEGSLLSPPVADYLYVVQGWRHETADIPHTYTRYDATRASPVILDSPQPVTVQADQMILTGVEWSLEGSLSIFASALSVNGSDVHCAGPVDITTSQLGLQVLVPWTGSTLGSDTALILSGSNVGSWALASSAFQSPSIGVAEMVDLSLATTSVLQGSSDVSLSGNLTIDATSGFNANGYGYDGEEVALGRGESATAGGGGGGGYGGSGGQGSQGARGGSFHSSALSPYPVPGSGGGNGAVAGATGGRGGGAISIKLGGIANMDGYLRANGADSLAASGASGGGGSGGSIFITADQIQGPTTCEVNGGNAAVAANRGGGGGGGRILLSARNLSSFNGWDHFAVEPGAGFASGTPGTAGVVQLADLDLYGVSSWRFEPIDTGLYSNYRNFIARPSTARGLIQPAAEELTVSIRGSFLLESGMAWNTGGHHFLLSADSVSFSDLDGSTPTLATEGANFTIVASSTVDLLNDTDITLVASDNSAGTFTVTGRADLHLADTSEIWGNVVFLGSNLTTDAGTVIHATYGYHGNTGPGTPGNMGVASGGSGGTYGNRGGRGSANLRTGTPYGSEIAPTDPGSGGGPANTGAGLVPSSGGQGGGLVRMESNSALGTVALQGDIDVSGGNGTFSGNYAGGGGAGGSVYVSTPDLQFAVSSLLDATGGTGGEAMYAGGGGGGGRIALCHNTGTLAGSVLVSGGTGPGTAEAGQLGTYAPVCTPSQPGAVVLATTNEVHMGDIEIGQTGTYPFLAFTLSEISSNEGALIDSLTLTARGTVDETTHLGQLRLVRDNNKNGIEDAGDVTVGTPRSFAANNGQLTFASDPVTEPVTPLLTMDAEASVDLLIVGALNGTVAQGLNIEIAILENSDLAIRGDLTLSTGQVVGAPVLSGIKTIKVAPLPAVSTFTPRRHSNASGFIMDVYGVNFTPNPATNPLSAQLDTWVPTLFAGIERISPAPTASHFQGQVPAAPSAHNGFYNVQVVTDNGSNLESAIKFEFFEPCDTGLPGLCGEGELVGGFCLQVNYPTTEICGNGIDEDCNGSDLSCTGTDDDGDGWAENQGDCNDDPTDPQAVLNNPGMGLICIQDELHLDLTQLSGEPRNIAVHSLAEDSLSSVWRIRATSSWYTEAREVLKDSHLRLDGSGDYVSVAPSLSLGPEAYLTVMGWVRFQGVPASDAAIVFKGGDDPATWEYGLYYHRTSGQFRFVLGTTDGNRYERAVNAALVLNHWFQVVGTYNAATGLMRLYLDGALVDSAYLSGTPAPLLGGSPLYVGGHGGTALGSVNGMVDEVRLFGRVLDPTDIQDDNLAIRQGLDSAIDREQERLYLTFDYGTWDESVRANHGTTHGDARISGRSGRHEFPVLAYTIATSNGVDLYDENHQLWMRIPVSTVTGQGALQAGDLDFAEMANGVMAVASADPAQGVVVFDFARDRIFRINSAGRQDYLGNFGSLAEAAYGEADAAWAIPDSAITGLDIDSDGDDSVLIGVGQAGYITAVDLDTAGDPVASEALPYPSGPATGLTFGEAGNLYYGYLDPTSVPHYQLIQGVTAWIAGGGTDLGVRAIDLPAGVTAINDASFNLAQEAPAPGYLLTVAHDQGLTWGFPAPTVASDAELDQEPPMEHCPTGSVVSVWNDFDSRYSACSGEGGGITHYDYNLTRLTEYIDDTYETNIVGRLPSLDVRGVAGYSNIAVAHALGVSFFAIPLAQGACVVPEELGICQDGLQYPIESGELVCMQERFEEHEYCGPPDSNCDGDIDPRFPETCFTGIPVVSVQPDLSIDVIGCDPIPVTLPEPIVVDDNDPAPVVACWTDRPDPVIINGLFNDWSSTPPVGESSSGTVRYSVQYTENKLSVRMDGTNIEGNSLGFRLAISEGADGVGCTVPTGVSGAAFQGPAVLPNWIFEIDDRLNVRVKRCDPTLNQFYLVEMIPLVATATSGLEMKIDLAHSLFAGTPLSNPNGLSYFYFWIYDSGSNAVSHTFPTANPVGGGETPPIFTHAYPLQRTIELDNMMAPGFHSYGCSATDFDGHVGMDQIGIVITKTSDPVVHPPPHIISLEATSPAGTYVQIRCVGGDPGAAHYPTCPGGTIWTNEDIAPPVPENCAIPLQITNNAPALFPVGITTVTWRVGDSNGASSQAIQHVNVLDTTPPLLDFPIIPGVTVRLPSGDVLQYIPYENNPLEAEHLVTPLCIDNGDPTPVWAYSGLPVSLEVGGLDGEYSYIDCTCGDRWGNSVTEQLYVVRQPPTTDPPTIGPLVPDSLHFFNEEQLFSFTVDGHPACPPPVVTISGADSVPPNDENTHYFVIGTEGISVVDVMATSSCYNASSYRNWSIGIDTVPPVLTNYDAVAQPLDPADTSFFRGFFPGESSPTFALTGRADDVGCGLQSVTARLVYEPLSVEPPPQTVTYLFNQVPDLGGMPLTGPEAINNPVCSDALWCDSVGMGVEIPLAAEMGPYQVVITAFDCAGNSDERIISFYALDLQRAIKRMQAAIDRYVGDPPASGSMQQLDSWIRLEELLTDGATGAQPIYEHTLAALQHEEFPTTQVGLYAGNLQMSEVMSYLVLEDGSLHPEATQDIGEIQEKLDEMSIGARIVTRQRYDQAVTDNLFVDEDQRLQAEASIDLGTTSLFSAERLVHLRNGETRRYLGIDQDLWDLDQEIAEQGADICVQSAVPVLDSAIVDAGLFATHAQDSGEVIMGRAEMLNVKSTLEDIWFVMHCVPPYLPDGNLPPGYLHPVECENAFPLIDPQVGDNQPNSEELAVNILDLLKIQGAYQTLTASRYVATFAQQYRLALAARVAITDGLDNAANQICGGWEHPIIQAAKTRWLDLEALRDTIIDPEMVDSVEDNAEIRMRNWSLLATDVESRCLAVYVYNAAYYYDTIYVDVNYYRDGEEEMNPILTEVICQEPPVGSEGDNLRMWLEQLDLHDDCECACSDPNLSCDQVGGNWTFCNTFCGSAYHCPQ
ncbi:MAG: hypothetical protein JW797_17065 [Bradymonadales bacterium]|nr:hypothetical protein [Bradymonadales bacterium]